MRTGSMDVEETEAAILKAEQAITLMDSRLQHKLRPEHKRALANAVLRSGAQDDLVFHHQTVRKTPGWTLGGLLARTRLLWEAKVRKLAIADEAEQLADWAARIRRSGARRLLIGALPGSALNDIRRQGVDRHDHRRRDFTVSFRRNAVLDADREQARGSSANKSALRGGPIPLDAAKMSTGPVRGKNFSPQKIKQPSSPRAILMT